jgi:uncharacterized protein (TIGR02996 family)
MHEEEAFTLAMLAAPREDAPRLVYADWLDARGDPRGELLRITTQIEMIERSEWPHDIPGRLARVRQVGHLVSRWRQLIKSEYLPWLAALHRGSMLRCVGVPDGECPGEWGRLPPEKDQPFTRRCSTCHRLVQLCWSSQEAEAAAGSRKQYTLAVVLARAEPDVAPDCGGMT